VAQTIDLRADYAVEKPTVPWSSSSGRKMKRDSASMTSIELRAVRRRAPTLVDIQAIDSPTANSRLGSWRERGLKRRRLGARLSPALVTFGGYSTVTDFARLRG
jgi:predicted nuclease with RNAse H fold